MELVMAFAPGATTGLLGFGALVVLAGRYWTRRSRRGWRSFATYALVVALLWGICLVGGGAMWWPLLKTNYDVHHAVVVFVMPYVVITPTIAGIALMKYGSELRAGDGRPEVK